MSVWRTLLPNRFPPARVALVANARLVPRGLVAPEGGALAAGVFRPDGSAVGTEAPFDSAGPISQTMPPATRSRDGAWIFGGTVLNHFGHVLVETGARLWAIEALAAQGIKVRGLLFLRKKANPALPATALPPTSQAILRVFAPGVIAECVDVPETVEALHMPEPGLSVTPERFVGVAEHWRYLRAAADRIPPGPGAADLYIARSGKGARGGLLFEADLEAALAAEGYRIYHPQTDSLEDQITAYRAARRIVAIDGSALHLAAAAIAPGTKVAVLARREFYAWAIADQLTVAAGAEVTVIDPRERVFNFFGPEGLTRRELKTVKGWSSSFVLPDLDRLGEALRQSGFVARAPRWPVRGPEDLARELGRAAALHPGTLREVTRAEAALQPWHGAHLSRD